MIRNRHKKFNGTNCFTDFKHHARSWHNSKKLRTKMTRHKIKSETRKEFLNFDVDESADFNKDKIKLIDSYYYHEDYDGSKWEVKVYEFQGVKIYYNYNHKCEYEIYWPANNSNKKTYTDDCWYFSLEDVKKAILSHKNI